MDLFLIAAGDRGEGVATILWIIAAIFVIGGIVTLLRGAVLCPRAQPQDQAIRGSSSRSPACLRPNRRPPMQGST